MTSFRSKKNVNPTGGPYTAEIVAITPKVHLKSLKTGSNKGLKDAVLGNDSTKQQKEKQTKSHVITSLY